MEIFWSGFRGLGHLLQYSSHWARQIALERYNMLWNRKKRQELPNLLARWIVRARLKKEEAQERLNSIKAEMQSLQQDAAARSEDEGVAVQAAINDVMLYPPHLPDSALDTNLPYLARFVHCALVVAVIDSSVDASQGKLELILDDSGTKKLASGSKFAKKMRADFDKLKREHPELSEVTPTTEQWRLGWGLYVAHKMRTLQDDAANSLVQLSLLQYLYKRVGSRRKPKKKLDKAKERENSRLNTTLEKLVKTCREVKDARDDLTRESTTMQRAAVEAEAVLSKAGNGRAIKDLVELRKCVLDGNFPWLTITSSMEGERAVERFRLPFHMALWEYERAVEEEELVLAEIKGLVHQFCKELIDIGAAMARHQRVFSQEPVPMDVDTDDDGRVSGDSLPRESAGNDSASLEEIEEEDGVGAGAEDRSLEAWKAACEAQQKAREVEAAKSSFEFLQLYLAETEALRDAAVALHEKVIGPTVPLTEEELDQEVEELMRSYDEEEEEEEEED